jgi:hypothetical protein
MQLSFKFRRYCPTSNPTATPGTYYGVAFPGTTNAALSPSCVTARLEEISFLLCACLG